MHTQPRPIPELVAPAGDWPALSTALASGADAVYFGVKGFSLRHYAANFEATELKKVMRMIHRHGCRGYLALNVFIREAELPQVKTLLHTARDAGVDAVIAWDLAVLQYAARAGLRVHLSTQAGASNSAAVMSYASLGAARTVLARECTLTEISAISAALRQHNPALETEVFIHGAMCLSVSGRCLLSGWAAGASANRGACHQYCRRRFRISDEQDNTEFIIGTDYILSAQDLCTIDFLDAIIATGVSALKIEGRMRSPEYIATVTAAYRQALTDYQHHALTTDRKARYGTHLRTVYHRKFSPGFYFGTPAHDPAAPAVQPRTKTYLGRVEKYFSRLGVAQLLLHQGSVCRGSLVLITGKYTPALEMIVDSLQQNHQPIAAATAGQRVAIKVPRPVRPQDRLFALSDNRENTPS